MAETIGCPVCQGSGMVGASSCGRCRGTGAVKMPDASLMPLPAAEQEPEVSAEVRKLVEDELDEALHQPRLKLKGGRQVRLFAGPRRGKGLGFKN